MALYPVWAYKSHGSNIRAICGVLKDTSGSDGLLLICHSGPGALLRMQPNHAGFPGLWLSFSSMLTKTKVSVTTDNTNSIDRRTRLLRHAQLPMRPHRHCVGVDIGICLLWKACIHESQLQLATTFSKRLLRNGSGETGTNSTLRRTNCRPCFKVCYGNRKTCRHRPHG